jgi:hypothetical protein
MRLHIRSNKRMNMLNRSIASSERCKEYAGRAESIYLGYDVDTDKLMDSGAFNPREISGITLVKFSTLSKTIFNRVPSSVLTSIVSTDRFQNLRRINLVQTTFDMALELPNLEIYSSYRIGTFSTYTRAIFNSDDLPNLRRLIIHHGDDAGDFGHLYESIIPQLDHLALVGLYGTELERLLFLSTSLQSLRCAYAGSREGLVEVLDQIVRIDVKELRYHQILELDSSDDWETDFKLIEKLKKLVEGKDELKRLKLSFIFEYGERPSKDVCDQTLARWNGIKDELESMCSKKGIEIVALTCKLSDLEDYI